MQDSIQLSNSDHDNQQINFFVSPNNSLKKQKQQFVNTASQESLAYSSQTHPRLQNTERSPIQIQIPNFESSEKPSNLKQMIRAAKVSNDHSPFLKGTQSQQHLLIQDPHKEELLNLQNRRKTINKKQFSTLSKKYKQMQYALQVQVISSEQLRTKVSILTELLQQKIKESELNYFLNLKNSSRSLKNIDIFVQLKGLQKKLKQTKLIVQQQKQQIKSLQQQFLLKTSRKQNINISNSDPSAQIQALIQQKQTLFNYIQQLRKQYNSKNMHCQQLSDELQRYQQKQNKFIILQRPKLIQQISERTQQIKQLQEQIQKLKMEHKFVQLNYQNQIEQLKNSRKKYKIHNIQKQSNKQSTGTMTKQVENSSILTQTQFIQEDRFLKAQLKLLKTQRDYYIQQFKKRVQESSQNYTLKLQLKAYTANNY